MIQNFSQFMIRAIGGSTIGIICSLLILGCSSPSSKSPANALTVTEETKEGYTVRLKQVRNDESKRYFEVISPQNHTQIFKQEKVDVGEAQNFSIKTDVIKLEKYQVEATNNEATIDPAQWEQLTNDLLERLRRESQKSVATIDPRQWEQLTNDLLEKLKRDPQKSVATIDPAQWEQLTNELLEKLKKEDDTDLNDLAELEKAMIGAYEQEDYTKALDLAAKALRQTSAPTKRKDILTRFGTLYLKLGAFYWNQATKTVSDDQLQSRSEEISTFVDKITQ